MEKYLICGCSSSCWCSIEGESVVEGGPIPCDKGLVGMTDDGDERWRSWSGGFCMPWVGVEDDPTVSVPPAEDPLSDAWPDDDPPVCKAGNELNIEGETRLSPDPVLCVEADDLGNLGLMDELGDDPGLILDEDDEDDDIDPVDGGPNNPSRTPPPPAPPAPTSLFSPARSPP